MVIKKYFYIAVFTVLGVLLGALAHAIVELPVLALIKSDYEMWSLGLSWNTWLILHGVWSVITFGGGAIFGLWAGRHFWRIIYVEKRYDKKHRWHKWFGRVK